MYHKLPTHYDVTKICNQLNEQLGAPNGSVQLVT